MTFNPLKEKGIPLDKQLDTWHNIAGRPYRRDSVDNYTRTRQILMNGIEIEAWGFKHHMLRTIDCSDTKKLLANIRFIEDNQETLVNWMTPHNQSVLDTTLAYEQVAVDLTAWLSQNEPDNYVKETYDFGLLEDFDHLYRYAQFAYMIEGTHPDDILHYQTDVMFARPTQYHHNDNKIRIRNAYDKNNANPRTKVNILTLLSGEQQTHNFYSEHGFMYGSHFLRELYAEISSIEEEHVTMYETLIDANESLYEKLLLHEFTEVCSYHNCYKDETDSDIKLIWEENLAMEIEHLQIAAKIFEEKEKRSAEEVIGNEVFDTCHFESQKEYVNKIANKEVNKRLDNEGKYTTVENLDKTWPSYKVQTVMSGEYIPSETAVRLITGAVDYDIVSCDAKLLSKREDLIEKAHDKNSMAPNSMTGDDYKKLQKNELCKEK